MPTFSVVDEKQKLLRKIRPFRQYRALLTQVGPTDPPVAVVSAGNELGLVVYQYNAEGTYTVTGNFPLGKTHIFCPSNVEGFNGIGDIIEGSFKLFVYNTSGLPKDNLLIGHPIRIEVDY